MTLGRCGEGSGWEASDRPVHAYTAGMCGRYDLDISTVAKVAGRMAKERWLQQLVEDRWRMYASHDVRPETKGPAVAAAGRPELESMRWGWHPSFMRGPLINSRWETVPTKNTFNLAFAECRCVVPATGYFEWQRDAKDKPLAKHMFRPVGGGFIRIAGLWTVEKGEEGPERRFLVITRPMVLYGAIHDRTPLILSPEATEVWLDPKAEERELFEAAATLGDDHLVVREVTFDKAAGKVDGPHLVEPLDKAWPWE